MRASLENIAQADMSKIRTEDSLAEGEDVSIEEKIGTGGEYGLSSSRMTRDDPNSPEAIQR